MIKSLKLYQISSFLLIHSRLYIFFLSLYFLYFNKTLIITWEITPLFHSFIYFPIILDPKGLLFSSVVLFISANVINFADTYITGEQFNTRFILLVLLFILSINILIFFPHLITLLLGWDGLGLTRFILVIYYQTSKSLGAGIITALTNRIGDALLLLVIAWSVNSNNWFICNLWASPLDNFIAFLILGAAITKRAQIPFSRWLPAAIAAPTPVSALVHSSTLVTAGVFIIIRFYNFLRTVKHFNTFLIFTASLTILIAGLSAIVECDLKKIIALSTLSQLGVMIFRLRLGCPNLAFFHLITHALFKALLFICAGSIIHFHSHGQDLRKISFLAPQLPLTSSSILIANISLCGLPYLSGFYSKDLILETSIFSHNNWLILFLLAFATILTITYSFRLTFNLIWGPASSYPSHFINNSDINILKPTLFLSGGAILAGSLIGWLSAPLNQEIFIPIPIKLTPILATILAAYLTYYSPPYLSSNTSSLLKSIINHNALSSIWFLAPLSSQAIIPLPLKTSHTLQKNLDQGWIEITSAQGIFKILSLLSKIFLAPQKTQIIILINITSLLFIALFLFTFLIS